MQVFKRTGYWRCSKCRIETPYWVDLTPTEPNIDRCYHLPCGHSLCEEPPLSRPLLAMALLMVDL